MPTQYIQTGSGGVNVVDAARGDNNDVEILDRRGIVKKSFQNITDLRTAKNTAISGDTIRVYPGNYVTRNLLKDGVNWHFLDGAIVTNPPDETGGIFENVGAHGSPNTAVVSRITGDGVFALQDPGGASGFSVVNLGEPGTNIYFECKEIRGNEDSYPTKTPTYFFHSGGTLEAHVGRFIQTTNTAGVQTRFLDLVDSSVTAEETESAVVDITVDEFDYSESSIYLGIQGTDAADDWRGISNLHIKTLRSGDDSFGAFFSQTAATQGYSRIQIDDHAEGTFKKGFSYASGSKPIFLDGFNINYDGGDYAINIGASSPNLYLRDVTIKNPAFNSSIGGPEAIIADSSVEVQSVGNNSIGGGSDAVGANVTIVGSDIKDLDA